jgi:hypothetical protein
MIAYGRCSGSSNKKEIPEREKKPEKEKKDSLILLRESRRSGG